MQPLLLLSFFVGHLSPKGFSQYFPLLGFWQQQAPFLSDTLRLWVSLWDMLAAASCNSSCAGRIAIPKPKRTKRRRSAMEVWRMIHKDSRNALLTWFDPMAVCNYKTFIAIHWLFWNGESFTVTSPNASDANEIIYYWKSGCRAREEPVTLGAPLASFQDVSRCPGFLPFMLRWLT